MTATALTAPIRSGAWAGSAPRNGHDACASIPGIAGWALEYVQPLRQWWDELLGDPAEVAGAAAKWGDVERALREVAVDLERAQRELEPLEGRTIRLLELRYADLVPVANDAAEWSGAVAAAVRLASSVVTAVRSFICDFLTQLGDLVDALFGFSLNPFDKVEELRELVDAAGELIESGGRLIQQMFDAFGRLIELIGALGPVIDEALTTLRETIADMLPAIGFALGAGLGLGAGPFGPLLGGLLGTTLFGAGADLLKDGEDVERYDIDELRAALAADPGNEELQKKIEAWEQAHNVDSLDSVADLVAANGTTDGMGGADSTAIDIKLVRGPDGSEHWVVSLPSTQEWLDTVGTGAMNDRNTNVALMLMENPVLKSQYERAVLQAMKEAGMAPGDPVVFTGFSQGGIMAANLASDPNLPYKPIGVVTNGSPIDTFDVPRDVPVISFQHASDPVAKLDLNDTGSTPPNVHRVVLPDPGGDFMPTATHHNGNYVDSITQNASGISEEYAWMGGEVVDHQVFSSTQR
ncbi:hypothetical protein ACWKWP_01985 [Agromyces soli]